MNEADAQLVAAACEARARSYSPYSGFRVGAALRCADGHVTTGVNVENASLGLSLCAERAAVARAVAQGRREFEVVAICADREAPTPPCGACRQVLLEFAPRARVIIVGERGLDGEVVVTTVEQLVPLGFTDYREADEPEPEPGA